MQGDASDVGLDGGGNREEAQRCLQCALSVLMNVTHHNSAGCAQACFRRITGSLCRLSFVLLPVCNLTE